MINADPIPKYVAFASILITLTGLTLHGISAGTINGAAGIVLNFLVLLAAAPLLLCALFPTHKLFVVRYFLLFFSIYFLFSGLARINAAVLNPDLEVYQNASDALTLFELSSGGADLDGEDLARITDTSAALKVFALFYSMIGSLDLPTTPGIGVTLNAILVAAGSAIGMLCASRIFQSSSRHLNVTAVFLATSGIAFLFAGLHLRDSFLYFFNALLLLVLLRVDFRKVLASVIPNSLVAACLVGTMTLFRPESAFILAGFALTIGFEMLMRVEQRIRLVLLGLSGVALVFVLQYILVTYSDLIDLTNAVYMENQRNTEGLSSRLIIDVPMAVRVVVGPIYMILAHVPFFTGFLRDEWYYWFVSIQATQALVVLPAFMYCTLAYFESGITAPPSLLRRVMVFFLTMAVVVSLSTVSYRHLGQFLPCLYVLAAFGYVECSRKYLWISASILVAPVSLLWAAVKL